MFFIFYANILDDRQKASQSWGSIGSRVVEEYWRVVGEYRRVVGYHMRVVGEYRRVGGLHVRVGREFRRVGRYEGSIGG